jgi:hypothetical protein
MTYAIKAETLQTQFLIHISCFFLIAEIICRILEINFLNRSFFFGHKFRLANFFHWKSSHLKQLTMPPVLFQMF